MSKTVILMGVESIIVAVVGGMFGIAAAGIPIWLTRRRHPSQSVANTASIIDATGTAITLLRNEVRAYGETIDVLRGELERERQRTDALQAELQAVSSVLTQYRHGVDVLIRQLRRLGVTPDWHPDST